MKLHIKNMVCQRCIMAVEHALNTLDIAYNFVQLGEIDLGKTKLQNTSDQFKALEHALTTLGFEILNSKQSKTIEAIKRICLESITQQDSKKSTLSHCISEHLHTDYSHLSQMFSSEEGITIEQYFITQRIEKVKERLIYDENSLSEIAFALSFSSVAHLSSQFKKVTGMTPTQFRALKSPEHRRPLDKL